MSTPNESPVISFLTKEENLLPALEIISRGAEIRDRVRNRFFEKLKSEIKKAQPRDMNLRPFWDQEDLGGATFELYARLSPIDKKSRGLQYSIEIYSEYCGLGLRWINAPEKEFEEFLKFPLVKAQHLELTKTRQGDIDSEPNEWWLWFEYWEKNLYDDPWIWFAKKVDDVSFLSDAAKRFWEFIRPTYAQVLKINEFANRLK